MSDDHAFDPTDRAPIPSRTSDETELKMTETNEDEPMRERTTVDAEIEQDESGWEFDESVAENFDSHVRKSIPNYSTIQTQAVKLTDWFVKSDDAGVVYDLGCATGTTIDSLVTHHRGADTEFVGIDVEQAMLDKAREKVGVHDHVTLKNQDLREDPRLPDASVVISLFTLSFIPEGDRAELLSQIYDQLKRGGALIFAEKTRADSALFQDIWNEHYWDFKSSRGLDDDQILGKARTLRGQLRPLSVDEYRAMLRDAGFADENVDIWYKFYPWLGVVARKA